MADVLTTFPPRAPRPDPPRHTAKYNWSEWFDGQIRRLSHGEDYAAATTSFRVMVYNQARLRGLRVRMARDGDAVIIQAFPDGVEAKGE